MKTARGREAIVDLAPVSETPFKVALGGGVVAAVTRHDRQSVDSHCNAGRVSQLLVDCATLLQVLGGCREAALRRGERSQKQGSLSALPGELGSCHFQETLQASPPFGGMLTHVPESKQGNTETEAPVEVAVLKQPIEGGAKIVMLDVAAGQPG